MFKFFIATFSRVFHVIVHDNFHDNYKVCWIASQEGEYAAEDPPQVASHDVGHVDDSDGDVVQEGPIDYGDEEELCVLHLVGRVAAGARFNRKKLWLESWLEKPLKLWLDIASTKKKFKKW